MKRDSDTEAFLTPCRIACAPTHGRCIVAQDLPRHRHSDPRLSVSFQSQTRWMAGEWKSWLKPNPTPLNPSILSERERERETADAPPFCLRPPLYRETRHHPRVIPRFDLRIIPFRVFCALKYKYAGKGGSRLVLASPPPLFFFYFSSI